MADDSNNTADTSPATVGDKDLPHTSASQVEESIDPENEIVGARLLLIHIGTTLATFLAGLVGTPDTYSATMTG